MPTLQEQLAKEKMIANLLALSGDKRLGALGGNIRADAQAREQAAAQAEEMQYQRGRDTKADEWRARQAEMIRQDKFLQRTQELADEASRREFQLGRDEASRKFELSKPSTSQPTEGERKSATLATRLRAGLDQLDALERTVPGSEKPGILERGLESLGAGSVANFSRGAGRQQANAAQADILDALLTASTGAAYTKQQFEDARMSYFPQPGDSAATVKAKKQRLLTTVAAVNNQAGRAAPGIDQALGASAPAGNGWKVTRVK